MNLGTGALKFAPLKMPGSGSLRDVSSKSNIGKYGPGRFLRQVSDSDRLLEEHLGGAQVEPGASSSAVLSSRVLTLGKREYVVVRAAVPVEINPATREGCKGAIVSVGIQATHQGQTKGTTVYGPSINFGNQMIRATAMAATALEVQDGGQYTFEVVAKGGNATCQMDILEPATLTASIFSPIEYLNMFEKSAKFLIDVDTDALVSDDESAALPNRINTSVSGPPVVTLKRKDVDLANGDTLLMAGSIEISAEDRTGETSAWLQLTRSPSGLNSHLNVLSLPRNGTKKSMDIFDWASSATGPGKSRVYLNLMGTGENPKPVVVDARKLEIYRFGAIDPQESVAELALDIPADEPPPDSAYGRWVDLFLIRSQLASGPVPPSEDQLLCPLFDAARGVGVTGIQGLARGIQLPTPVQHHYPTRWEGGVIVFPVLVFENIYHDKQGDPAWALQPPAGRENRYTKRFYEVRVSNPGQPSCQARAILQ